MRWHTTFWLTALVVLSTGCSKLDPTYYTRSGSPGYKQAVFKTTCPVCGKEYSYSQQEWDAGDAFKCPLHRRTSGTGQRENAQALQAFKEMRSAEPVQASPLKQPYREPAASKPLVVVPPTIDRQR